MVLYYEFQNKLTYIACSVSKNFIISNAKVFTVIWVEMVDNDHSENEK